MSCPPYLPIVTTPVRYNATVFVHEAYNYLTQTGHDHCAHYNYINRTCHLATLRISQISAHQNFTTCYVAAVHDSIYDVSCSDFNRAVQILRRDHGQIAEGMWKQAAVTTCALISCNIYVYTYINKCAFECSVSVRNLKPLVHANSLIYAALLYRVIEKDGRDLKPL